MTYILQEATFEFYKWLLSWNCTSSKIEELVKERKEQYTIIVTHNMQQAARVSDRTAFFLLGELVECGRTEEYITGRFG